MLSSLKISHKLALMVVVAILSFVTSEVFTLMAEQENSSRLGEVEQKLYPTTQTLKTTSRKLAASTQVFVAKLMR